MKVLYGGPLAFGHTCEHRLRALARVLQSDVVAFPFETYLSSQNPFTRRLTHRLLFSAEVRAINQALIRVANAERPDVVWLDKPVHIYPETVSALTRAGMSVIAYICDDPYGPRNDGVWRHFKAALPEYSAHVVTREVSRQEFLDHGAKAAVAVPMTFEPSLHFPAASLGLRPPRTWDVTFVGSPYDNRAEWLAGLAAKLPEIRLGVFGPGWRRHEALMRSAGLTCRAGVWNDQYREVLWRSKLSLSFVTRANRDELSHKAVEIAASGTAVLVEPSPVHDRVFVDGVSAFVFSDPAKLAETVSRALSVPDALDAVGARASEAVRAAGLSNDEMLGAAFRQLGLLP